MKLVRPLKIGYGRKVQTALAEVTDGRADILGQKVVLRCFDTLYVSPDLLEVIPFCRNRFTMSLLMVWPRQSLQNSQTTETETAQMRRKAHMPTMANPK